MRAKTFINWNGVEIVKIDDRYFGLNEQHWNGYEWSQCWETDSRGFALEDNDEEYTIKPIYEGVGEPDEDGDYDQYDIVAYELV